jgi:hypothetical protein
VRFGDTSIGAVWAWLTNVALQQTDGTAAQRHRRNFGRRSVCSTAAHIDQGDTAIRLSSKSELGIG